MSKCTRCGKPAGLLYAICPSCMALSEEERRRPPAEDPPALGGADAADATAPDTGLYATFPRRLNALSIDSLVLIAFSALVFVLVPTLEAMPTLRVGSVLLWWATLILYEPIAVARFGGTVGHRLMNLRVVDDRTGGNVSFGRALGRLPIKGFFGFLAFASMHLSRRHLAIHDIVTKSSVQIRIAARAQPHHYVHARS